MSQYDDTQPLDKDYVHADTILWTDINSTYGPFDILAADCE